VLVKWLKMSVLSSSPSTEKKKESKKGLEVSEVVKYLTYKPEALNSNPNIMKEKKVILSY
jgi:hypothetical protein